jgi:hypothetical protein
MQLRSRGPVALPFGVHRRRHEEVPRCEPGEPRRPGIPDFCEVWPHRLRMVATVVGHPPPVGYRPPRANPRGSRMAPANSRLPSCSRRAIPPYAILRMSSPYWTLRRSQDQTARTGDLVAGSIPAFTGSLPDRIPVCPRISACHHRWDGRPPAELGSLPAGGIPLPSALFARLRCHAVRYAQGFALASSGRCAPLRSPSLCVATTR